MENNFIPVTVWRKNKYETWQLDISNLNLSDLIILRNTLVGYSDNGIRIIDRIVTGQTTTDNTYYRECKKICKREKEKIKQIKSPADCDRKMSWSARKLFTDPETIW